MKTNRDQLNHALHQLRGDTLSEVVSAMETPSASRTVYRRRWMVATAACLSVMLLLGATVGIPMLRADEVPLDTPPVTQSVTQTTPPSEELSYYASPIVRLNQLSAGGSMTISDPDMPGENLDIQFEQTDYLSSLHVLIFDCLPGETVTIRANKECLGYVEMAYDFTPPDADYGSREWKEYNQRWFDYRAACDKLRHRSVMEDCKMQANTEVTYTPFEREVTFDPSSASVILCFEYTSPADMIEEDVLLFTVTNEEGQITGAGGLYVGKKYYEESNLRNPGSAITIARASVLESVRFTNPAAVTEAQAETLLASIAEKGKDGRSMVDFSPVTYEEIGAVVSREILDTVFKNQRVCGIGRGVSGKSDYTFFEVMTEGSDVERNFIILKDGTWIELLREGGEISGNGHNNAECPHTEEQGYHGIGRGCIVQTTDGRFFLLESPDPANPDRITTVIPVDNPLDSPVEDPTV